jgi:hypothetical protein
MAICLTDWNTGMRDAEAGSLPRFAMPPDYYGGYYYACALNYESMDVGPEPQVLPAPPAMHQSHCTRSLTESLLALAHATEDRIAEVQSPDAVTSSPSP